MGHGAVQNLSWMAELVCGRAGFGIRLPGSSLLALSVPLLLTIYYNLVDERIQACYFIVPEVRDLKGISLGWEQGVVRAVRLLQALTGEPFPSQLPWATCLPRRLEKLVPSMSTASDSDVSPSPSHGLLFLVPFPLWRILVMILDPHTSSGIACLFTSQLSRTLIPSSTLIPRSQHYYSTSHSAMG